MKHRLHWIFTRYLEPAGEDGSDTGGGGGAEDRGDNCEPTDDDTVTGGDDTVKGGDDDTVKGGDEEGKKEAKKPEAKSDGEEEEGEEEGGDKGGKDKGRKDTRIPIARHKEILDKTRQERDELAKQLSQYQNGDRIQVINDDIKKSEDKVTALDAEYTKLVTDGEHAKAAEKMKEIRTLERDIAEKKGDLKAQAASARAVEKMRYDIVVERLEAAYPVLNPDSDEFDKDEAQDVADLAATYRQRGHTPAEAIQKAAKKLLGSETKKQNEATDVKPRVDKEEAEAAAKKAEEVEAARKKKQVEKNVDTTKKQPPDTSKVGADHDKAGGGITAKDVMRMSQDDFNKLSEEDLSKMRGDAWAGA